MIFLGISYFIKKKWIQNLNFYFQKECIDAHVFMLLLKNVFIILNGVLVILFVIWKTSIYCFFYCYLKNLLSARIFSTRVGKNKEHCLFTCEQHLKTVLLGVDKNMCISPENDDTVCVEYSDVKEVYCKDCLKHYMRLLYSYFYFVEFWMFF